MDLSPQFLSPHPPTPSEQINDRSPNSLHTPDFDSPSAHDISSNPFSNHNPAAHPFSDNLYPYSAHANLPPGATRMQPAWAGSVGGSLMGGIMGDIIEPEVIEGVDGSGEMIDSGVLGDMELGLISGHEDLQGETMNPQRLLGGGPVSMQHNNTHAYPLDMNPQHLQTPSTASGHHIFTPDMDQNFPHHPHVHPPNSHTHGFPNIGQTAHMHPTPLHHPHFPSLQRHTSRSNSDSVGPSPSGSNSSMNNIAIATADVLQPYANAGIKYTHQLPTNYQNVNSHQQNPSYTNNRTHTHNPMNSFNHNLNQGVPPQGIMSHMPSFSNGGMRPGDSSHPLQTESTGFKGLSLTLDHMEDDGGEDDDDEDIIATSLDGSIPGLGVMGNSIHSLDAEGLNFDGDGELKLDMSGLDGGGPGIGVDDDLDAILTPVTTGGTKYYQNGNGHLPFNVSAGMSNRNGQGTIGHMHGLPTNGSMATFTGMHNQGVNGSSGGPQTAFFSQASIPNYPTYPAAAGPSTSVAPPPPAPSKPAYTAPSGLSSEKAQALDNLLRRFWTEQMDLAERGTSAESHLGGAAGKAGDGNGEFKHFALPLARIKKVMKSDPEVKMISAEVPVLLSKSCESKHCASRNQAGAGTDPIR